MNIQSIVIETHDGKLVDIARTGIGALVIVGDSVICEMTAAEPRESRIAKATEVAKVIYGQRRDFKTKTFVPKATNSMIHDVLNEMERVARC